MAKGYKFLTIGAGLMLIAGFVLPWLEKSPFYFSGYSLAMLGYPFLAVLPLAGAVAVYLSLARPISRAGYALYPGMAGVTALVAMAAYLVFFDTGAVTLDLSPAQETGAVAAEWLRVKQADTLILFHPVKNLGFGFVWCVVAIAALCLLPMAYRKALDADRDVNPGSYRTVIHETPVMVEYKRFNLILAALAVLAATYVWCGISPAKLWENRGNAREYLFGRTLSQADIDYINDQKERAPMIEALGKAREYMSNKYRNMPFSEQPDLETKEREMNRVRDNFLAQISEKEAERLRRIAEQDALKEKKGGYFPPETSPEKVKGYLVALIETIAIAVWGTLLAVLLAVPVSFFAARNTLELILPANDMKSRSMRTSISFGVRRVLDSCRGFNEFVMALIFVAVIGLGPYAGILALWIHTFGILGKVFSEQIEAIESGQVEALTSTGASAAQTIAFSVMPQVMPVFVSYTLLRFESNVRSAAILGFVGAGGIGFLIFDKLNGYLFREVCTMMIIIILTVGIIDHFCARVRMKFI